MNEANTKRLVAFGEVLWDCLESGLYLGGAPLNVAYHAARLGAESFVVSSVGRDFLGDQAVRRMRGSGLKTDLMGRHPRLLTGASVAQLDESGDARYEILQPVAWDEIDLSQSQREVVAEADILVYGSLAARSDTNERLLCELLESSRGLKVCDVNLRAPYDDPGRALILASRANVLKVNEEELAALTGSDGSELEEAIVSLHRSTGVELICVTRGAEGAALWCEGDGKLIQGKAGAVKVADTIGAGDSFTAALATGILDGLENEDCLDRALRLSSFVASKSGAQPKYDACEVLA